MFNTIFSKNDRITIRQAVDMVQSGRRVMMVLPLAFLAPDNKSWWWFPVEPLISISGKNVIVKRNVVKSKMRGTVKERWAEDDLQISIQGSLIGEELDTFPSEQFTQLHQIITQSKVIKIQNELLQLLNVSSIVVESYSFPFSKGENVQNFSIDAVSDDDYRLLIEKENV